MWTYLAIFLSLSIFIGVFVRRYIIFLSSKSKPEDSSLEDATDLPEKRRLSKKERGEVEKLFKRGESFLKAGKEEDAIKCFVQALAIDAFHKETQNRLAVLYLQKQMYGAASALFKQLVDISPDPVHFSHLGLALFQQSDFEGARCAYCKALELDPSRPQRFVSLSQVYRALGRFQHSVIALNKALEIENENLEFMFLLAEIQAESGDKESAKKTLKKILEADPKNSDAKILLNEL